MSGPEKKRAYVGQPFFERKPKGCLCRGGTREGGGYPFFFGKSFSPRRLGRRAGVKEHDSFSTSARSEPAISKVQSGTEEIRVLCLLVSVGFWFFDSVTDFC